MLAIVMHMTLKVRGCAPDGPLPAPRLTQRGEGDGVRGGSLPRFRLSRNPQGRHRDVPPCQAGSAYMGQARVPY